MKNIKDGSGVHQETLEVPMLKDHFDPIHDFRSSGLRTDHE